MTDTSRRKQQRSAPGVIDPTQLYCLEEFLARMQWGKHAWRTARRNGLRVLRAGGRAYVLGSDAVGYLARVGDDDTVDQQSTREVQP